MANRAPEDISPNSSRIARSALFLGTQLLPAPLKHVGFFGNGMYLLHTDSNKVFMDRLNNLIADTMVSNSNALSYLSFVIEWSDIDAPTLFNGGMIASINKEEEMTLLAFYLAPDTISYLNTYETLKCSGNLLDRSIRITSKEVQKITSRFQRLILE